MCRTETMTLPPISALRLLGASRHRLLACFVLTLLSYAELAGGRHLAAKPDRARQSTGGIGAARTITVHLVWTQPEPGTLPVLSTSATSRGHARRSATHIGAALLQVLARARASAIAQLASWSAPTQGDSAAGGHGKDVKADSLAAVTGGMLHARELMISPNTTAEAVTLGALTYSGSSNQTTGVGTVYSQGINPLRGTSSSTEPSIANNTSAAGTRPLEPRAYNIVQAVVPDKPAGNKARLNISDVGTPVKNSTAQGEGPYTAKPVNATAGHMHWLMGNPPAVLWGLLHQEVRPGPCKSICQSHPQEYKQQYGCGCDKATSAIAPCGCLQP